MKATQSKRMSTETMVLGALLTALVFVLQFMGAFVRFGPFSISLVLIPIVIGVATCGVGVGTWLGFVFGAAVLASGDAAAFLAVNVPGTIVTVFVKGAACGLCAGLVYKLFERVNRYLAVAVAAVVCPVVNTGVFLIGCLLFFMDTVAAWAEAAGLGGGVGHYMIFGLVGINFLVEMASNIILSPVVVRLLNVRSKQHD
ncbi:MAG: ECF transporter S component [Clostridia bacterium]|nr:ECF transporter S component [Clostridia bacterium]